MVVVVVIESHSKFHIVVNHPASLGSLTCDGLSPSVGLADLASSGICHQDEVLSDFHSTELLILPFCAGPFGRVIFDWRESLPPLQGIKCHVNDLESTV